MSLCQDPKESIPQIFTEGLELSLHTTVNKGGRDPVLLEPTILAGRQILNK